ncbi:MAG: L-serine ammonia-lyase [Alphaproteobacteria bacterium]|nr:MAG: L-serine ammonia-lyase [Alphaproteobacteria bacterium]
MTISIFDLFKVGIGPSSSHTVGPMVAARRFVARLAEEGVLERVARLRVDLFGSLALTGKGHGSDIALILGLAGETPATVDPDAVAPLVARVRQARQIALLGTRVIAFDPARDIAFNQRKRLPFHSNAMTFAAFGADDAALGRETYYSIGGGFVVDQAQAGRNAPDDDEAGGASVPYDFASAAELLALGARDGKTIAEMMLENEMQTRSRAEVEAGIDHLWAVMDACIERGCRETGTLPGGLNVKRRAPGLHASLLAKQERALKEPLSALDWINLWAMAVNEENAAGGRVVTAPTNGAAGILPAVLRYYDRFCASTPQGIRVFLLTAGAIGALYKRNASISGAEVGCQGEVGVACSMAAAGLTAALGGSNAQIENAAEIGMEHNLGLTCDPIGGLVQIPCIERNAMGAIKAIDASRLALMGDGQHMVSLDKVIETMRQTGRDMKDKYKETSKGGLAVNVVEC